MVAVKNSTSRSITYVLVEVASHNSPCTPFVSVLSDSDLSIATHMLYKTPPTANQSDPDVMNKLNLSLTSVSFTVYTIFSYLNCSAAPTLAHVHSMYAVVEERSQMYMSSASYIISVQNRLSVPFVTSMLNEGPRNTLFTAPNYFSISKIRFSYSG